MIALLPAWMPFIGICCYGSSYGQVMLMFISNKLFTIRGDLLLMHLLVSTICMSCICARVCGDKHLSLLVIRTQTLSTVTCVMNSLICLCIVPGLSNFIETWLLLLLLSVCAWFYLIYSRRIFDVFVSFGLWEIIKIVMRKRIPNPSRKAKGGNKLGRFLGWYHFPYFLGPWRLGLRGTIQHTKGGTAAKRQHDEWKTHSFLSSFKPDITHRFDEVSL